MAKKKVGKKTRENKRKQKEIDEDPYITKQPHSIIIPRGKVGKNTTSLIADFKNVMEPFTATNIKHTFE
jgi:ribosome biogenesis protein SSF1/2